MAEDPNEVLKRQLEYFRSDQLLIDRAAPWRGLSPEECLVATIESCREVETLFSMMEPEVRERAMEPAPVPDEILVLLEAVRR